MTTSFLPATPARLYNDHYVPVTMPAAPSRVDRLRAIARSDYSVGHRLREMLLTRITFDAAVLTSAEREESVLFKQVLAEGQRVGVLWVMDDTAITRALI